MKIVYLINGLCNPGGMERIVTIKANSLVEDYNHEVVIITSNQGAKPSYYQLSSKIKMYDLDLDYEVLSNYSLHKRLIKRQQMLKGHKKILSQYLCSIKADIVISTFNIEASFLAKIKDGSKKILESHFCYGHKRIVAKVWNYPFITRLAYHIKAWQEEHFIVPSFDKFVVLTQEDMGYWQKIVNNVTYIPNISPFENEQQADLVNKRVIAVGRLDAQKGFDRLINIWSLIAERCPDWQLDIYGAGSDEGKLHNQIKKLCLEHVVTIHAPDKNIKERYLQSSIHVMTSTYEGLPMTLLEAASVGLPTIAFDFKCGPKDVIIDGKSGYIIPSDNSEKFGDNLLEIMTNPVLRSSFGREAKLQSMRYTKGAVIGEWIKLFENI